MYYDLITSLPSLPRDFLRADRLPITSLRLKQRLKRLSPHHLDQLHQTESLVTWRPRRMLGLTDASILSEQRRVMELDLEKPLRQYLAFRMDQRMILASLRHRLEGHLDQACYTGVGDHWYSLTHNQERPDFGLQHVYPWITEAHQRLSAGDALALERLMMTVNWEWLQRCAERDVFGFVSVFAFVVRWDMLRAWLQQNADQATNTFRTMIDKVTRESTN